MNKITEKIRILLGIVKQRFGKVATDKAEIFYDGETLEVNAKVYNDEGAAVEDGEYADEKNIYTVKDSVVVEIKPKETEEKEVTTEKTETTETTETTEKEQMAEETIVDEVKDETVEKVFEPTVDERVDALEELVETLYEEIRQMKAREVEAVAKNEEIIREFSAMRRTPTAESVTRDNKTAKVFGNDCSKVDKLKSLRRK